MSDSLICSFLVSNLSYSLTIAHFLWVTWADCSFLVSNQSNLLTSLIFGERPERFTDIAHQKRGNSDLLIYSIKNCIWNILENKILDFFIQIFLRESLIRSFPLSDMSELLTVAQLSSATWAIRSRLLISSERPEQFADGCSFFLSDLSESLTVPHLIWAKWVNE